MAHQLTPAQLDAFGAEMDALRDRIASDLGAEDAAYLRKVLDVQRKLELLGRGLLFAGVFPPAWIGGVIALAGSKILDNMEIGHNVLHGQYDWMRDDVVNSQDFEWDIVVVAEYWKRSHNFQHHTYTNIMGKDRDIGYGLLRITPEQQWRPYYLGNPIYAVLLSIFFEWGVMLHDLDYESVLNGEKSRPQASAEGKKMAHKALRQLAKDYLFFPLLSGPFFLPTLAGNAVANLARNLWAFAIIFCGHFPEEVATFTEEEAENESRGQWYVRQLLGSANITGSKLFHVMTGNLSHQIEHHLFPDLPARRYGGIAAEVRAACERYGLPYNTGSLGRQLGSVARKIVRLALPGSGGFSTRSPEVAPVGRTAAA
jgi:fatty acid desaturase